MRGYLSLGTKANAERKCRGLKALSAAIAGVGSPRIACASFKLRPSRGRPVGSPYSAVPRSASVRRWWRGLDSNQRTLARADLQSAAFNHSATSPQVQAGAPCGGAGAACQRAKALSNQRRLRRRALRPLELSLACAPALQQAPGKLVLERVKRLVRRRRWPVARV